MSIPVEVLAREVLKLPAPERARLLEQVIGSLDVDEEQNAKWRALAAQRDAQADADPSLLVSLDEAMTRLRAGIA